MSHTPATLLGAVLNRLRGSVGRFWRWEASLKGVQFMGACELVGRPVCRVAPNAQVIIGDGARICSSVRANPLGLSHPTVLATVAPGAKLVLGQRVGLSGTTLCAAVSIEVGDGTIMGADAMVLDNDLQLTPETGSRDDGDAGRDSAKPVKIGRGVFIGARAMVLKGVTIGDGAIVGAGAVVTEDVPPRHIAAGNPARVFKPKPDQSKA